MHWIQRREGGITTNCNVFFQREEKISECTSHLANHFETFSLKSIFSMKIQLSLWPSPISSMWGKLEIKINRSFLPCCVWRVWGWKNYWVHLLLCPEFMVLVPRSHLVGYFVYKVGKNNCLFWFLTCPMLGMGMWDVCWACFKWMRFELQTCPFILLAFGIQANADDQFIPLIMWEAS